MKKLMPLIGIITLPFLCNAQFNFKNTLSDTTLKTSADQEVNLGSWIFVFPKNDTTHTVATARMEINRMFGSLHTQGPKEGITNFVMYWNYVDKKGVQQNKNLSFKPEPQDSVYYFNFIFSEKIPKPQNDTLYLRVTAWVSPPLVTHLCDAIQATLNLQGYNEHVYLPTMGNSDGPVISFVSPTFISQINAIEEITIYPNPSFSGDISIKSSKAWIKGELIDLATGKIVRVAPYEGEKTLVEGLSEGLYVLRLDGDFFKVFVR